MCISLFLQKSSIHFCLKRKIQNIRKNIVGCFFFLFVCFLRIHFRIILSHLCKKIILHRKKCVFYEYNQIVVFLNLDCIYWPDWSIQLCCKLTKRSDPSDTLPYTKSSLHQKFIQFDREIMCYLFLAQV